MTDLSHVSTSTHGMTLGGSARIDSRFAMKRELALRAERGRALNSFAVFGVSGALRV
jgi:hypothetical protein